MAAPRGGVVFPQGLLGTASCDKAAALFYSGKGLSTYKADGSACPRAAAVNHPEATNSFLADTEHAQFQSLSVGQETRTTISHAPFAVLGRHCWNPFIGEVSET